MAENRSSGLLSGIVIGAALGAGAIFLFGTKKGKELRSKARKQYPEMFEKLDEVLNEAKNGFSETYDDVASEVKKVSSRSRGLLKR